MYYYLPVNNKLNSFIICSHLIIERREDMEQAKDYQDKYCKQTINADFEVKIPIEKDKLLEK